MYHISDCFEMNYDNFIEDISKDLPQLVPIWHDFHYQRISNTSFCKNVKKETTVDIGGAGIDVSVHENQVIYSEIKNTTDEWNFSSTCCTLPFLPNNKMVDLEDPCLAPFKQEKERFQKFCSSLNALRRTYKYDHCRSFTAGVLSAYGILKKMEHKKNYEEVRVPISVMQLAMDFPTKNIFPPINLSHAGGSLATSGSVLLHPEGEKLNRLGITTLQESNVPNKHFQVASFEENSLKLKKGLILQVSSAINGYCYVRQKNSCHFVDFSDLNNIKHSRIIQGQELLSISSSPYCPTDFIVMHNKGNLELQNIEENEAVWSLFKHEYNSPCCEIDSFQCSFGTHPQSALTLDEHNLNSFDMRLEANQKTTLFSTDYASCYLNEMLVSCKGCAVSPFQHVLSSNYHLFVCDERYPRRPVLIYNHMLKGYPLYCESSIITETQNSSDSVVVLGTQDSNELCAFAIRAQHSIVQPVSLSPPLHLSTFTDYEESLKLHCIPVDNNLTERLSYPLVGVNIIPHSKSGYTVFQLNSCGDLFYQDFSKDATSTEKGHKVNMGCNLTPPEKILPHIDQFVTVSDKEKNVLEYSNHMFKKLDVDLLEIFSVMNDVNPFCKICNADKESTISKETDNRHRCLSCGISNSESVHMSDSINNMNLLIGPTKEIPLPTFCDISPFFKFEDKYSKKILEVWGFQENEFTGATQIHSSDSGCITSTPVPSNSAFLENQLKDSKDALRQSSAKVNVMEQLFGNMSSLNSSSYDFSGSEAYDEFVPPSQDIRPMIGETLRKPKRPRTSNTTGSFSLAGF